MKKTTFLCTAAASAAALLVVGCASTGFGGAQSAPLAWAPADTAFVFGNLERTPKAFQERNSRWMETMRPGIVKSLARLQSVLSDNPDEAEAKAGAGLLALLQQELNKPDGFANLGMDVNSRLALYEVHALPVLRLELADKARFETFMQNAMSQQPPDKPTFSAAEIEGQRYWYSGTVATQSTDDDLFPRGVMAVVGNHLVITLDVQRPEAPLADLLGLKRPAQSVVDAGTIAAINKQYGYHAGGPSGFIDNQRLLTRLIGDGQNHTWISKFLNDDDELIDATCRSELQSIIGKAPRLVGGATTIDNKQYNVHALLEMPAEIAKDLSTLPSPVPGLGTVEGPIVFGGGIDISAGASFLQKHLAAVQAAPYQCEYLDFINEFAEESATIVSALHMAEAGWIQGLRVEFSRLDLKAEDFSGILLLASPKPTNLIGVLQGFVPEIAKLGLQPDGVAKQLEDSPTDESLWVAMGEKAVGAALGDANRDKLPSLVNAPALPQPPLLYMEATGQAYVDMMSALDEETMQDYSSSGFEELYNFVTWPLTEGAISLYKEIDRLQGQWQLTERGMEFTQNMSWKQGK